MSGYRVMAGIGEVPKTDNKPDEIDGTKIQAYLQSNLTHRIGVGVTMSISRTRNNNYLHEMGLREVTGATSGMYEVAFSLDGTFSPEYADWLKYAFMMGSDDTPKAFTLSAGAVTQGTNYELYSDAKFTTKYTAKKPGDKVYLATLKTATGSTTATIDQKFGQPMLYKDVSDYLSFLGTKGRTVNLFGYTRLQGPKYFDIGYQKINAHASGVSKYDSTLNEMGILVGCIIDSIQLGYESGSDAGVKFSISGHALKDIIYTTEESFDYSAYLDSIPTSVFVGGCVSVFDSTAATPAYEPVAQTDSAAVAVSNNITKLGNCLKLNYSSYAMGSLDYDVSTSTYSNDPNKYLKYFYGYTSDMTTGKTYYVGKQPKPIGNMKIRTDDTSATVSSATMFMDINMSDVYVGDMSNSYSVDTAIMDEPSLRATKLYLAVGYTSSS